MHIHMTTIMVMMTKAILCTRVPSVTLLLLTISIFATAGTATGARLTATRDCGVPQDRAFFAFGDSYADTGNRERASGAFHRPYGMTWPGYPTGRASDGHIQIDYLATQAFGLSSPPPSYVEVRNGTTSIARGINFAVGGSGMTHAFGLPTVGTQVDWFESFISAGNFSVDVLACSVVFFCLSGNDYDAANGPVEGLATEVVSLERQALQRLYELGVRNIMVTTVAPWSCLPATTFMTNYTACIRSTNPGQRHPTLVVRSHDQLLENAMASLQTELSGINLLLLNQAAALTYIQEHSNSYGFNLTFAFWFKVLRHMNTSHLLYSHYGQVHQFQGLEPWQGPSNSHDHFKASHQPSWFMYMYNCLACDLKYAAEFASDCTRAKASITEPFRSCCAGLCGTVDAHGNPRYTVCADPEHYMFFDRVHPTDRAWMNVVDLYLHDNRVTQFASTLRDWVLELP